MSAAEAAWLWSVNQLSAGTEMLYPLQGLGEFLPIPAC